MTYICVCMCVYVVCVCVCMCVYVCVCMCGVCVHVNHRYRDLSGKMVYANHLTHSGCFLRCSPGDRVSLSPAK